MKRFNDALTTLVASNDESVRRAVLNLQRAFDNSQQLVLNDIFRLLDQAEGLQSEIKRLNDQVSKDLNKIVNHSGAKCDMGHCWMKLAQPYP